MTTKPTVAVRFVTTGNPEMPAGMGQGVSWSFGRQNITDQWQGGTITVYGRSPSSWVTVPALGYWTKVTITNNGQTAIAWGIISDYKVIYGPSAAYDTWELTLETGLGVAGRKSARYVYADAGASTGDMVQRIQSQMGTLVWNGGGWGTKTSSISFADTNIGDAAQTALNTDAGYLVETQRPDGTAQPVSILYGHNSSTLGTWKGVFSDDMSVSSIVVNGVTEYLKRYTGIEFRSAAYNYGTQVVVQAAGLADQYAGSGDYTQTWQTINYTTDEAFSLANYYLNKYTLATTVPYSITMTGASNSYADAITYADPTMVGKLIRIDFRGTTYYCIVEGVQFNANPSDWSATLALSASTANAYLKLDSPVLGTLDTNRLGF